MAISLQDAKATVNAFSGSDLFNMLKGNVTFHDASHFSELNARAALTATKPSCGYYYKTTTSTAWQNRSDPAIEKVKLAKKDKKSQWKQVSHEHRHAVTADDCLNIVVAALGSKATASYKQHRDRPDTRFLFFNPMPDNYGAATVHRNGNDTVADLVCLVFNKGGSWQLTTHFPCDSQYRDSFADLA